MKTIRVAERAQEDLLEIWEYIAGENPEGAERLLQTFREKFELLLKPRHTLADHQQTTGHFQIFQILLDIATWLLYLHNSAWSARDWLSVVS